MHSVTESANKREGRRAETARRIHDCALELADTHGLDGFTMDELAETAGVSRRTLFNYFDSKVDAVLGPPPEPDDELAARFVAGGPDGDLFGDLVAIAVEALHSRDFTSARAARARRVLRADPRLLAAAHTRFDDCVAIFTELTRRREGTQYDEAGCRVALQVLVAIFGLALDDHLDRPSSGDVTTLLSRYADTARRLLAVPAATR